MGNRWLIDGQKFWSLSITHRLVIDLLISYNLYQFFFLTYSQIGIGRACRKPMYIGHDKNRMANEIYLLDSNWNIKNEMFRRSRYVLLPWLLQSVSLVRKAATAECLPGKRSWIKKACIVTFMSKKSLFLYFRFVLVSVPWDYINNYQWLINDWKFCCGLSIIHQLLTEYRI